MTQADQTPTVPQRRPFGRTLLSVMAVQVVALLLLLFLQLRYGG